MGGGDPLLLFCLPHAGGSAAAFRGWERALWPDALVQAVEYPGRGTRMSERPIAEVRELALALHPALSAGLSDPKKDFALFGYSLGAFVAFELARLFEAEGRRPVCVAVAAGRAPSRPERLPPLHPMQGAAFRAELSRMGGTPQELLANDELMELVEVWLRADLSAGERYAAETSARVASPIHAFAAEADARIPVEDVAAWEGHTDGGFALHTVPGGHFFGFDDPPGFLPLLSSALSRARRGSPR